MAAERPARNRPGRQLVVAGAVAVLLVAALGLHAWANSLDHAARTSESPAAQRARMARGALTIEPWNERFVETEAAVRAQSLLGEGKVDEAYFLLLPFTTTVRDDPYFRETYQQVLAKKWVIDARKAHQQHAREAEDGALKPEDVIP